jgi:aspartate/glutamate racemase
MALNQLLIRLIDIGAAADNLCSALPDHRMHTALRDLHTQISIAMLSMSESTRKHIACN